MRDRAQPREAQRSNNLRTFVDAGLIVAVGVLLASFYVRFVNPYPPLWTAFAMPAAMALFGLRMILLPPGGYHHGRSPRAIGSLLIALSLILLVVGLVELDHANKSRAAHYNPNPTNTDPLNSTVPTDSSGDN